MVDFSDLFLFTLWDLAYLDFYSFYFMTILDKSGGVLWQGYGIGE